MRHRNVCPAPKISVTGFGKCPSCVSDHYGPRGTHLIAQPAGVDPWTSPKAVASRPDRPMRRTGSEDASAPPPLAIRSGWWHPMSLALDLCAGLSQFLLHAAVRCGGPLGPRRARQNSIVESPSPGRDCSLERVRRYSHAILRLSRLRPDAPLGNDLSEA